MTYFGLGEGVRKIPASVQAEGEVYSTAIHNYVQHNQELIHDTVVTRQLVNDYYPNTVSFINSVMATPTGGMFAQWGRFDLRHGMKILSRAYAAKKTTSYSDDTVLHLFSTPKMLSPSASLSRLIASYSSSPYYATDVVDSSEYAYYPLELLPNPQSGKYFYLSLFAQSADQEETDNSEIFLRFFSSYEEPNS